MTGPLTPESAWVGVDPGADRAFGLAFIYPTGEQVTHCLSHADEALAKITVRPLGVGVDPPL